MEDRRSESETPTNVRWSVFSLAFATSALLYLHRYAFASLKPTVTSSSLRVNLDMITMPSPQRA